MKVQASFPTACRAEQAVHAPAEPPGGWHTADAALSAATGAAEQQPSSVSGAPLRRGRAFPTTRPHPGTSSRHLGIGP